MKVCLTSIYSAFLLIAGGILFGLFPPAHGFSSLLMSSGILVGLGLVCVLVSIWVLNQNDQKNQKLQKIDLIDLKAKLRANPRIDLKTDLDKKYMISLSMIQFFLLFITFLQFYWFEFQSGASGRFVPLIEGTFFGLLKQQPVLLGLVPWVLYTVLGIGWAYYSRITGRSPLFLANSPLLLQKKYGSFLVGLSYQTYAIASLMPFAFVGSLIFVSVAEVINDFLGWDSLFLKPLKTIFISIVLLMILKKRIKQLSCLIERSRFSLGKILLFYVFVVSGLFLWLHGTADWFIPKLDPALEASLSVSPMIQKLSHGAIETRLSYLMLGWWLVWTPLMASWVARVAMKTSLLVAFLHSLVVPVVFFVFIIPEISIIEWNDKIEWFSLPVGRLITTIGLIGFVQMAWGNFRKLRQIFSGGMLPMAVVVQHSTKQWVEMALIWLSFYLIGWFVLGWLPMQFVLTVGIFFIFIHIAISLYGWASFLYHQLALKKYKVLG